MVEQALILSLAVPAFLLAYIAFKMKDKHSIMKILFTGISMAFALGIPFTGFKIAEANGYGGIANYLIYFELAIISTFVMFVFYLIWFYISDVLKIISGNRNELDQEI